VFETEAAAWREVARQLVEERQEFGLCCHAARLWMGFRVNGETWAAMRARLADALEGRLWAYPVNWGGAIPAYYDDHREARCLAALWFALEAEEEGV
jgi:hypothetical protein